MARWIAVGVVLCLTLGAMGQAEPAGPQEESGPSPLSSSDTSTPLKLLPPETSTAEQLEQQGDQLRAHKQFLDAVDSYQAAIGKKPSAILYNKLGMTYVHLQRFADAKKAINRSIKLDRDYSGAYNNLASTFYIQHKYSQAIRIYRKALSLAPNNASYHANLGAAYLAKKKVPEATSEFIEAVRLDPDVLERSSASGISAQVRTSPEARAQFSYLMAKTYAKGGDTQRSLVYLRKAMEEGYKDISKVYQDQEFAGLRETPEFKQLMSQKVEAIPQ